MSTQTIDSFAQVLRPFRRLLLWVGLFSAVANLLSLSPTLYMLQVYDRIIISQNEITLIVLTLLVLMFFAIMALSEWLRSRLLVRLGVKLDDAVNLEVFRRGFESNVQARGIKPVEALQDLVQVRQFITGNGAIAFFDVPWIPVYIGVSFMLHYELGIAALVFAVIQLLIAIWIERSAGGKHQPLSEAFQGARRFLQAKIRSAEVIDAMGMRSALYRRWQVRHTAHLALQDQSNLQTHHQLLVSKFVQYSQQSLILGLGALLVIDNQISPASMVAANLLLGKALAPLQSLVSSWRGFLSAKESYARLQRLFNETSPVSAESHRVPDAMAIRLHEVSLSAPKRTRPILQSVSLDIPAGQSVLIMGPSGAGKSTLARLITGEQLGQQGEVLIGGLPANECDRHVLGYLPQEIELIEGTVAENISRFDPRDPEAIVAAARAANAHDLIQHLPQGYDTPVGVAGQLLSGGQRQRVALARALYGQPRLLVLDEPNANLDDAGERALVQALGELRQRGVTVLVISHRPNLISSVDRLVLLQAGQIVRDLPASQVKVAPAKAPNT